MAAATRGLSAADISLIRETLAAGRKPKVVFTEAAGQIVGKVGQVIELTDPKKSDEWIVVRFGRDELPFSPADLVVPSKAPPPKTPPGKAAPVAAAEAPPGPPLRLSEPPAPVKAAKAQSATVPTPREEHHMPAATPASPAAANGASPAAEANGKPPARAAKAKPTASLTVTLSYADREWTIAAQQGSKTLAKPYVIKPTEALQMVALIDMPGVHEAVETIIEAERAEAESRALKLREELAEIESRLAELTNKA
jgi:hypothetical protein